MALPEVGGTDIRWAAVTLAFLGASPPSWPPILAINASARLDFASMDTREVPYDDGHGAFRRPLLTSMPRLANDIQHRNLLRAAPEQRIGFLMRHAACSSLPAAIHASRKSEQARPRQSRHDRPHRRADHIGDLAIRKVV